MTLHISCPKCGAMATVTVTAKNSRYTYRRMACTVCPHKSSNKTLHDAGKNRPKILSLMRGIYESKETKRSD